MTTFKVMATYPVQAGRDHLAQFTKKRPLEAVAELIWNALDAEATLVSVKVAVASAAGEGAEHVTAVTVTDNGHGFTHETACQAFATIGDSWKRSLGGLTVSGDRILHGSKGRGRFFAYSLGSRAEWTTVYDDNGTKQRLRVNGDADSIDQFEIEAPEQANEETGTQVEVMADQGKPLHALLDDDFHLHLLALLADYLLATPTVSIEYRNQSLNPEPLIEAGPMEVDLPDMSPEDLEGSPEPVLRIVEWKDDARIKSSLVLCTSKGTGVAQIPIDTAPLRATGYLQFAGFSDPSFDPTFAEVLFPKVIESARQAIAEYAGERVEELKTHIVEQLRSEGAYPYDEHPSSPVERAERDLYHHIVVTVRGTLEKASRESRNLTARLLRVAVEERPDSLDVILRHAIALPPDIQEELADLLSRSTLASIVKASTTVTNRIDLLTGLRRLLYESDESRRMREVDQLHPLVAGNEWLFGEEWQLSRSETSLTNVIRAVVPAGTLLEDELSARGGRVTDEDDREGRVDLLLHRQFLRPTARANRLVVELKRPSATVTEDHLSQVKRYARTLAQHDGIANGEWEFWLLGTSLDPGVAQETNQQQRPPGLVIEQQNYRIWVFKWGDLIDGALRRLSFIQEKLDYEVDQLDAVQRLRLRYGDLVPQPRVDA